MHILSSVFKNILPHFPFFLLPTCGVQQSSDMRIHNKAACVIMWRYMYEKSHIHTQYMCFCLGTESSVHLCDVFLCT